MPPRSKSHEFVSGGDSEDAGKVYKIDIAEISAEDEPLLTGGIVVLKHFEYGLNDSKFNSDRLDLLGRLLRSPQLRVVILSTNDPMFWLFGEFLAGESRAGSMAAKEAELRRWSEALSSFEGPFRFEPDAHTPSPKEILETCTQRERIALYQLAQDDFVNPHNWFALEHLMLRGLVHRQPGEVQYRITDEAFQRCVEEEAKKRAFLTQNVADDTAWKGLKRVFVITGLALAVFVVFAWGDFFAAGLGRFAALSTVAAGLGGTVVPKLIEMAVNRGSRGGSTSA